MHENRGSEWNSIEDPNEEEIERQENDSKKPMKEQSLVKKEKDSTNKYKIKSEHIETFKKLQEESKQSLKKVELLDSAHEHNEEQDIVDDSSHGRGHAPWLGAMRAPSWYKRDPNLSNKPNVSIKLSHIHGYRSKDCRNNVYYIRGGKILYNAAGVAVVFDIQQNKQQFFTEHSDDVTAIALTSDQNLVATGQCIDTHKNSPVYIWNVSNMQVIQKISGIANRGCAQLAFSPDGSKLAAVSMDDGHEINIVSTKTGAIISSVNGGPDKLFSCKWKDEIILITAGEKHLRLWNTAEKLTNKRGIWGNNNCSTRILGMSINPINSDILLGSADGTVQVFKMNICKTVLQLHNSKPVDAINFSEGYLITGGRDSNICILSQEDYSVLQKIDAKTILTSSMCTKIRSVSFTGQCKYLIVSTLGSEIYQILLDKNEKSGFSLKAFKLLISGHYSPSPSITNEVWGLDLFPDNHDLYGTVSDDSTLRVWSLSKKKQLNCLNLTQGQQQKKNEKTNEEDLLDSQRARSIGIAGKNLGFLVGFKDGSIKYIDSHFKVQLSLKPSKEWISVIKFSPLGGIVAVGSHDATIYIFSFPALKIVFKLQKHSSFITHLDFSLDGKFIRSVCGAHELLFWNIDSGQQIPSGATELRDEEWLTHSCIFAWPVQKMWKPNYNDYADINCVDRSHSNKYGDYILANGDDYSLVNLFKWPCVNKNAQWIESKGHCSHVTSVRFSFDDQFLISTGGEDNSVIVWKLSSKQ